MTQHKTYISYPFNEFKGPLQKTKHPLPQPTGTEVLVRVDFCGVCHSDVHIHEGYYDLGGGKKLHLEDRGIHLPVTLGHEIVGHVVASGEEVKNSPTGTALIYPWIGCGKCAVCLRGEENLCTQPAALGIHKPGGYAQYVLVPHPRYIFPIGKLNPAHASLLACSGLTTFSAIKKIGNIHNDEAVVVLGCGGLGLLAIRMLSLQGAKNIIALDLSEEKRNLAHEVGAHHTFNPLDDIVIQEIQNATQNNCLAVLDFVGAQSTVEMGIQLPKRGGKVILVGLHGGELSIPIPVLITRAISIIGSYTGTLNEQKELIKFAQTHDLFTFPIDTTPLNCADHALSSLAKGKVQGRLVLDNR